MRRVCASSSTDYLGIPARTYMINILGAPSGAACIAHSASQHHLPARLSVITGLTVAFGDTWWVVIHVEDAWKNFLILINISLEIFARSNHDLVASGLKIFVNLADSNEEECHSCACIFLRQDVQTDND